MLALRALESVRHALHDLLEVEALPGVEDGRVPNLGIDDSVAREILAALVGNALEGLLGLHDRDRVREATEVERQRPRRCTRVEPPRELRGVSRGQSAITLISGQLDDRAGAQTSIEVVVEENFGSRAQRLERDHVRRNDTPRCASAEHAAMRESLFLTLIDA